jgi:uncharacterized protein YcgL (UPF0745 family)
VELRSLKESLNKVKEAKRTNGLSLQIPEIDNALRQREEMSVRRVDLELNIANL